MLVKNLLCCSHENLERLFNPPLFGLWDRTEESDRKNALDNGTGQVDFAPAVNRLIYFLCQGILGS